MIFLLLSTAQADCELAVIAPDGHALGVAADGWLARGSLVSLSETCLEGRIATVLSESWHYRQPGSAAVPLGSTRCVATDDLTPLGEQKLIALSPPPGARTSLPPGTLLSGLTCTDAGYAATDHPDLTAHHLAWVRPISPDQEAIVRAVQQTYAAHFGPISLGEIPFSDWGYVGLPLPHRLTDAEIAVEATAEGLVSDKQREKVTTDLGPLADGVPIYTHFTGADPRYTDLWARPETIAALLTLAAKWSADCTGERPTCTLQIGDLAWYSDLRPDPLGHADHYQGTCVDVRLFRYDGSRYEAYYNRPDDRDGAVGGYSADLTAAFLHLASNEADTLYFNDPVVIAAVPAVEARRGHDDHIHLCFQVSR
ncbi:MAG: hypothetical protein ACI8RZ_001451 [Myxococcota bacterium]|jgi:hypothetical protein